MIEYYLLPNDQIYIRLSSWPSNAAFPMDVNPMTKMAADMAPSLRCVPLYFMAATDNPKVAMDRTIHNPEKFLVWEVYLTSSAFLSLASIATELNAKVTIDTRIPMAGSA